MSTLKEFRMDIKPNWCPGCGDFSVLAAIQKSVVSLNIEPEDMALISGIGCSGRISGYVNVYSMHTMHGRALAVAQGVKLANPDLNVICAGGDGDGFGIGLNHFAHAARRNVDITYIVMDNQIYGLTKGQMSPTSPHGMETKSSPGGNPEQPVNPLQMALASGSSFIAQAFSGDVKQLMSLIEQGIKHKGFSFINVFSPCVTFNKILTYEFFKKNLVILEEKKGYDPSNRGMAFNIVEETSSMFTGVLYKNERKTLTESLPKGSGTNMLRQGYFSLNESMKDKLIKRFI
ncbi:2-oxoacid:ferredoxin oxidoreductase subunit beta [Cytobacillus sp. NCCP-133]|uniref:2-oxoacid:ferredoxin oxidoreductase subunit beta n=1 Tax=Cytobacillus sp. NCCP-133 TaxID=766848 RepID=UPI002232938B|nr:2-oxoacid:ferredoxin oxidoreductase subunit beta [Cytobacillus sp. NCCP-133]GLB60581.1 2-oxoglutarate ferredoxin oxidoreductase subunit beta [Cytobacillus sp. NCCP-133]